MQINKLFFFLYWYCHCFEYPAYQCIVWFILEDESSEHFKLENLMKYFRIWIKLQFSKFFSQTKINNVIKPLCTSMTYALKIKMKDQQCWVRLDFVGNTKFPYQTGWKDIPTRISLRLKNKCKYCIYPYLGEFRKVWLENN